MEKTLCLSTNRIENPCDANADSGLHQEDPNTTQNTEILIKLRQQLDEEENIEKQKEISRYARKIYRISFT